MANLGKIKFYDGIRGLDYTESSVNAFLRSPDMLNVYKDYSSSKGKAIETILGFRRRLQTSLGEINGFYLFEREGQTHPILHVGSDLYLWRGYPQNLGVKEEIELTAANGVITFESPVYDVLTVELNGEELPFTHVKNSAEVHFEGEISGKCRVSFIKDVLKTTDKLYSGVGESKLQYFAHNNKLYVLGNGKYLAFNGENISEVEEYIPTTYTGISNTLAGESLDFRNILSYKFKNTLIGDGSTKTFALSEKNLANILSVKAYGEPVAAYTADLANGKITFTTAPASPESKGYDHGSAGIEVIAERTESLDNDGLLSSSAIAYLEGRVVISAKNGRVYYSALDDPTYFPEVNFLQLSDGQSEVVDVLPVGSELFVGLDKGVYLLQKASTGEDLNPIVYTSSAISDSLGVLCKGIEVDGVPYFLTADGLRAITSPDLKLNRQIERKSTLVEPEMRRKIAQNKGNLCLFYYDGYICVRVGGDIYLGDTRELYRNERGEYEPEWFYLSGVGEYEGQYYRYDFADCSDESLQFEGQIGKVANPPLESGEQSLTPYSKTLGDGSIVKVVKVQREVAVDLDENGEIVYQTLENEYAVKRTDEFIGGSFLAANGTFVKKDNVWFTTENGVFCFNFDKKQAGEKGVYTFDGRTIASYFCTMPDHFGYPDLRKSCVPKSLVLKLATGEKSRVFVYASRADGANALVGEISAKRFDFESVDFSDLSFNTSKEQVFVLNDRDKNFLTKQISVLSNDFQSAFALEYLSTRYRLKGKIR